MTDFVTLWLTEGQRNMGKKAAEVEGFYERLQNKDSNYGRAHRLVAEAYRKAEQGFTDALASQNGNEVRK